MDDCDVHWTSSGETEGEGVRHRVAGGTAVVFSRCAPGKTTGNEDTAAVFSYGPAAAVLAVADGAGGLPAGQRASRTAIATLGDALQVSANRTQLLRTAVLNGIEAANQAVIDLSNGSATTLTVVTIEGRAARSYHVGDSVAMITGQRGALKLQTVAHSPVGFAVEAGFLGEREAMYHVDRHVVSNFLGSASMRIDVSTEARLAALDTVVVSSDGLNDNLHTPEIVERVRIGPVDQALRRIVDLAERRMRTPESTQPSKPDDLTVILFRKDPPRRRQRPVSPSPGG